MDMIRLDRFRNGDDSLLNSSAPEEQNGHPVVMLLIRVCTNIVLPLFRAARTS